MSEAQQKQSILVVANDPDLRMIVRLAMEEAGYEVHEAQVVQASCAAHEKSPSLMIVDLSKSQEGEPDAVLTAMREHPKMKVIAIGSVSRPVNRRFVGNPSEVARTHQFRSGDRRNAQRNGLTVACVCLALLAGCANPSGTQPVRIHDIQILEPVSPQDLYVATGDEVRWHNLRSDPVRIGLLSYHHLSLVLCEKGFRQFGMVGDTATILPMSYVSLCFSRPGIAQYNVWLNPADPRGRMTPTARIEVSNLSTGRT